MTDHTREHAAERPHVERVVVLLEVDEELRPLEVSRRDADVVLGVRVVELRRSAWSEATSAHLGQSPVDQAQFATLVVDHDVVRLDVAVHDPSRVAEVERLEELEDVESDVVVCELGV